MRRRYRGEVVFSFRIEEAEAAEPGAQARVMRLARQCHDHARSVSPHVITTMTIEDEQGARDKLNANVTALEERLGRKLKRSSAAMARDGA